MKNTTLLLSEDIHPSYYKCAGIELPASAVGTVKPKTSALPSVVHVVELLALSVVTAVSLFAITGHELRALLPYPTAPVIAQPATSPDIEQRLELVGQILDYLVTKVEKPLPPEPAVTLKPSKTVRVTVPKAFLREGPGKNFSVVTTLPETTELLVQEEVADWLQVISPTGEKAWISTAIVAASERS